MSRKRAPNSTLALDEPPAMPALAPHPRLAGFALEEVMLQVLKHGEHLRLGVDTGMLALWQRPLIRERACAVRQHIAERNAARFVAMVGPDPVFSGIEGLEGL